MLSQTSLRRKQIKWALVVSTIEIQSAWKNVCETYIHNEGRTDTIQLVEVEYRVKTKKKNSVWFSKLDHKHDLLAS